MKKKEFIETVKKQYKCTLTAQDIIGKTDFFDKPKEEYELQYQIQKAKMYKKSFITSSCVLAVTIIAFLCIIITNNKTIDNLQSQNRVVHVKDDTEVLTAERKNYLNTLCPNIYEDAYYYIFFDDTYSVYLYKGSDVNKDDVKYSYFYIIDGFKTDTELVILEIDGVEKKVTYDNNIGLLLSDVGNNQKITFKITCRNTSKMYTFEG